MQRSPDLLKVRLRETEREKEKRTDKYRGGGGLFKYSSPAPPGPRLQDPTVQIELSARTHTVRHTPPRFQTVS